MEKEPLKDFAGEDSFRWICDTCNQKIARAGDGWLQWITFEAGPDTRKGRDLTLVHHAPASPRREKGFTNACHFDGRAEYKKDGGLVHDMHLDSFLGPDGLIQLLLLIAEGELPTLSVIEIIKRLHVPGYERARLHFEQAISEGVFEPNMPEGFYWQSDINAVHAWLDENEES